MGRSRAARAAGEPGSLRRRGRLPLSLLLILCVLGVAWTVRRLSRSARASGVAVIDARRFRLQTDTPWTSPTWDERLGQVLGRLGAVSALDRPAIRELSSAVDALSFVAEVGEPEVLWPDGLTLPLRLHVPVACVKARDSVFLPVAEDGTVLDGSSAYPHEAYGAWLPVIGPNDGALAGARPGEVLVEPRHLDALAVAVSMWNHLGVADLVEMGRILIDASHERAPDGLPGGVRLDLERKRRILFGRPPGTGHPGELPEPLKWAHVAEGLRRWRAREDWALLDVRWDQAVVVCEPTGADGAADATDD